MKARRHRSANEKRVPCWGPPFRFVEHSHVREQRRPVLSDRFGSRMLNLPIKLPLHALSKCHQFGCQEINESTETNRAAQVRMEQNPQVTIW